VLATSAHAWRTPPWHSCAAPLWEWNSAAGGCCACERHQVVVRVFKMQAMEDSKPALCSTAACAWPAAPGGCAQTNTNTRTNACTHSLRPPKRQTAHLCTVCVMRHWPGPAFAAATRRRCITAHVCVVSNCQPRGSSCAYSRPCTQPSSLSRATPRTCAACVWRWA